MITPNLDETIVVLGCRVRRDGSGRLVGAAGRRVRAAAALVIDASHRAHVVVAGGQVWDGIVEADAMRDELVRQGLASDLIDRERRSLSTRENARYVAAMLGHSRVAVVTCDWHLRRAVALFQREGFEVRGVPAPSGWTRRFWRWGFERVSAIVDGV